MFRAKLFLTDFQGTLFKLQGFSMLAKLPISSADIV
jgi:hypothetical protein